MENQKKHKQQRVFDFRGLPRFKSCSII